MGYEYSSNSRHCVFAYGNMAEETAQKKAWSHLGGAPHSQVVRPEESKSTGKPVGQQKWAEEPPIITNTALFFLAVGGCGRWQRVAHFDKTVIVKVKVKVKESVIPTSLVFRVMDNFPRRYHVPSPKSR